MAKPRPTEEELGIVPTADEMASPPPPDDDAAPIRARPEDDIRVEEDEDTGDGLTDQERAEGRKRGPDGKFEAKKNADGTPAAEPAPVATADLLAKPRVDSPPVPPGLVDVRALQESRANEKKLMDRITTLLEITQRREAKAEQAAQPKPDAPVVPDKLVDPIGYYDHNLNELGQRLAKFEQADQQTAQQREQQAREDQETQAALAVATPQYQEAAAADPTIAPVYDALLKNIGSETIFANGGRYDAQGNLYFVANANPAFRQDPGGFLKREMTRIENSHIRFAVANSMNVAEYMRDLARSRGVQVQQAAPAPTPAPAPQPAPAPTPAPVSIAQRQQQQERHMSLTDAPGGQPEGKIDAKTIAKMSNAEFAKFAKNMDDAKLDELMGGRG